MSRQPDVASSAGVFKFGPVEGNSPGVFNFGPIDGNTHDTATTTQKSNEVAAFSFSAFAPAGGDKKESVIKFPGAGLTGLPPPALGSSYTPAVQEEYVGQEVNLSTGISENRVSLDKSSVGASSSAGVIDSGVSTMSAKDEKKENVPPPGSSSLDKVYKNKQNLQEKPVEKSLIARALLKAIMFTTCY